MEGRIPPAFLLVAVAGSVLFTGRWGQPAPAAQAGPVQRPQDTSADKKKSIRPASAQYCETTPEPLRPLCAERILPEDPPSADWRRQQWIKRTANDLSLSFLVVTVSDPEATGDTLSFDRAIESVQNAAESLRYSMHRYWIPWRALSTGDPEHAEEAAGARSSPDQPGVLMFRAPKAFLLVFLVGESPVFGVQRTQFLNALDCIRALSPDLETVRIAGPNFSGSFPSLRRAIGDATGSYGPGRIRQFRLISPSATVKRSGETFGRPGGCKPASCYNSEEEFRRECGKSPQAQNGTAAICYDSIVHNDSYADEHLGAYLARRWGLGPREQAVLSESSTDFGASLRPEAMDETQGSAAKQTDRRLEVGFPRGISRLRNAYPEATARNLFTPGGAQPTQEERLKVSLTGPGSGGDMVPGLPNRQMPVTQEAMLLEIASSLRQQDVRLAQIGATDVFDAIFIAGFLAKASPEVRLYLADADWLLPRAVERFPLVGSLAVTTFPLIAANQLWRPPERVLHPMSSRSEVGFFNAVRALLLEQKNDPGPLLDYASAPGHSTGRPPLWLTVVGTNGYWPIALLDAEERGGDSLQLSRADPSAAKGAWPKPAPPGRIWWTVFAILVAGAFVLGAMVILAQPASLRERLGGRLAQWAARPEEPGAYGRGYFALSECVLLGVMLFVVSNPASRLAVGGVEVEWLDWVRVPSYAALLFLAAAAVTPWAVIFWHKGPLPDSRSYLYLSLLPCLGLLGFAYLWPGVMRSSSEASLEAFFFGYRSLDFSNGVNPVLPLLLLGGGLLALSFLHHRRHTLFLKMPEPPHLGEDTPFAGLQRRLERTREPLGHPLVSRQPLGWLLAAAGMASVPLIPFEGQQSLECQRYDLLYLCVLLLCYVLVVLTWARIMLVWIRLQAALDQLACHPLRQAMAALPASGGTPAPQGTGRFGLTDWLSASIGPLRTFVRSVPDEHAGNELTRRLDLIEEQARAYLSLQRERSPLPSLRLASLEKLLTEAGTQIAELLQPPRRQVSQGATQWAEAERAGNEFLAVQYARFLSMMTSQLRGLILYVTVGFCLAMLSTLVYPFRSHQELVFAGTLNFVLLGIPVAMVVVRMEHHVTVAALTRGGERSQMAGTLLRLSLYAAGPLIALISPHFPALGRYLVSLLEPAMQALR